MDAQKSRGREKVLSARVAPILLLATILSSAPLAKAVITDVNILPELPKLDDAITISVSGVEPYGGVRITDSIFNIDGTSLGFDLYLTLGVAPVITPWSYSEDIGSLPIGIYDLTINTIVELEPFRNDTFFTAFEVVPEPSTFLFLTLGTVALRRKKR